MPAPCFGSVDDDYGRWGGGEQGGLGENVWGRTVGGMSRRLDSRGKILSGGPHGEKGTHEKIDGD